MNNFEKFKEDITVDELVKATEYDTCAIPIITGFIEYCNHDCKRCKTNMRKWLRQQYFKPNILIRIVDTVKAKGK